MSRRSFATGCVLLLGLTLLLNLYHLYQCGSGLSPLDDFSEIDALRSGEKYAKVGFLADYGLPNVSYGDKFKGQGTFRPSGHIPDDPIYHGYPPGPNWLAGVSMVIFGEGHIPAYRVLPVGFGLFASTVFFLSLVGTFGEPKGMGIYLACTLAPMFTNLTHDLHFAGYALSLLLLEIAALLTILRVPGFPTLGRLALLFLITFAQGWFSFEYAFLTAFCAVPLAFVTGPRGAAPEWRKLAVLVLICGAGFVLAHALHFLQSVAYFGSVRATLDEYAFRSAKVYGVPESVRAMTRAEFVTFGLTLYARSFVRWTTMFSPLSLFVLTATAAVLISTRLAMTVAGRLRLSAVSRPAPRDFAAIVLALAVALGWFAGKPYHALNHITSTGRHLFLFYFVCSVVVARATELRVRWLPAQRASAEASGDGPTEGLARGMQSRAEAVAERSF